METREKIIIAVLAALVLVLGGTTFYYSKKFVQAKENPQQYVQQTVDSLVKQVGQLMELPAGEVPTVATVVDPEKLKGQPFFAHASVGDKVLIYGNARKVVLYNPNTNKIVEVAPLSIGNPTGTNQPAPTPTPTQPTETDTNKQ